MANVLIIGASRGIGLETVRAALRAGHSVRALARSAAGINRLVAATDRRNYSQNCRIALAPAWVPPPHAA